MKIRTSFVTNSSSSNYVTITIQGKDNLRLKWNIQTEQDVQFAVDKDELLQAKTMEELCAGLKLEHPEKCWEKEALEKLIEKLSAHSLDEIDGIEFEDMHYARGEFVESALDGYVFKTEVRVPREKDGDEEEYDDDDYDIVETDDVDTDTVSHVETCYTDSRLLKLKTTLYSARKDVFLREDEEAGDYDPALWAILWESKFVEVPEDVTVLEPDAFEPSPLSTRLEKIAFLGKLKSIGKDAFEMCEDLRMIVAPKTPLSKFRGKIKKKAILGFASCWKKEPDSEDGIYEYEPKIQAGYLKYIKEHREELAALAEEDPDLQKILQEV